MILVVGFIVAIDKVRETNWTTTMMKEDITAMNSVVSAWSEAFCSGSRLAEGPIGMNVVDSRVYTTLVG